MIVVALADSDSYLKWAAATLDRIAPDAERHVIVVANPVMPSAAQRAAATAGSRIDADDVSVQLVDDAVAAVERWRADVVLVAMRGPLAALLLGMLADISHRPVLVSGIPGIALPARQKALVYRAQADLMVVHSHRERRAFAELDREVGLHHQFGLSTLPFLERRASQGNEVVFAAQALVPSTLPQRRWLVDRLVEAARRSPEVDFVIKVRSRGSERQTHDERWPLDRLAEAVPDAPLNLQVRDGSMTSALDRSRAVVSVSSTALIEAASRGIPAIALSDFGVGDDLLNAVFEGSGLLGTTDDVIHGRFRHAESAWCSDNYLHDPADDDAAAFVNELVEQRRRGALTARPPRRSTAGGALRHAWYRRTTLGRFDHRPLGVIALAVGVPARAVVRAARRVLLRSTPTEGRTTTVG